jgi:phosphopentomutase
MYAHEKAFQNVNRTISELGGEVAATQAAQQIFERMVFADKYVVGVDKSNDIYDYISFEEQEKLSSDNVTLHTMVMVALNNYYGRS